MPAVAVLGVVGLATTIGATAAVTGAAARGGSPFPVSLEPPSVVSATPHVAKTDGVGAIAAADLRTPRQDFAVWAGVEASRTGVPVRALEAYAAAAQRAAVLSPTCHLSWATLAGIGYVESQNGGLGGGLRPSGRPEVPIYGVRLDGVGPVAVVSDSDHGSLDGDPTLDRAVGPMQFLPSSWLTWGSDGDGDGVRDPQDIDDAALAAARYLCAAGDLSSATGWTAAVLSYNDSTEYLTAVYAATEQIAVRSRG